MLVHSLKHSVRRWLIDNHWRMQPFIPDRYFAFRFPGGKIHWNLKNSSGMLARALGTYETEKMEAVLRLLRPGSAFVDVGGNVGDFSLLAASVVGDTGTVLCFEPEPTNCGWIARSIKLNGYKNILVFPLALSDTNGEAPLYLGDQCGFHTLLKNQPERKAGVIMVRTRTLDSLLEELGREKVDMMKIDVEGAELQVLKGACATLKKNPDITLLMELHPLMGVNPGEVCDFLSHLGLSLFQMSSPFNAPVKVHDKLSELLAYRR